jgi:hypothetical protein
MFRDEWLSRRAFFLGEKAQKIALTCRSVFSSRAGSNPGGPTNLNGVKNLTSDVLRGSL